MKIFLVLCVFIKTPTRIDGTIPNTDTLMNVKLYEVPRAAQTDSYKEKVFVELMEPEGHGRVRTFGIGPSPRDVFGARSSSLNTVSQDEIQLIVQSQVEAQLEAKVAEQGAQHKYIPCNLLYYINLVNYLINTFHAITSFLHYHSPTSILQ